MKGQAATEFLMTYGWAIIAVIAAISILAYFSGGFNRFAPSTCSVNPPFACLEYKASGDVVYLGIQNRGADTSLLNLTLNCNQDPAQQRSVGNLFVRAQDRINGSYVIFSCPMSAAKFKADFTILYQNSGETQSHTALGALRTVVE